jgi:hypothetical protein
VDSEDWSTGTELDDDGYALCLGERKKHPTGGCRGSFQSDIHLRKGSLYEYNKVWSTMNEFEDWLCWKCQAKGIELSKQKTKRIGGHHIPEATCVQMVCS